MDMEPKKIESMDDLRAAMNDPEIQAASKEFSKKYLKANRPKSLVVVILAMTAVFLMIGLSQHKASSVTPVALRTGDAVTVVLADNASDAAEPRTLTGEQREALLELLGSIKVERASENPEVLPLPYYQFSAGEDSKDSFTITASGKLITSTSCYEVASSSPDQVWSQLEAICGVG